MADDKVVLGEYELIGKNRSGEFVELVFKRHGFETSPLDTMRFDHGSRTSIIIRDRKLAKGLHDEEKFRIVLEKVE